MWFWLSSLALADCTFRAGTSEVVAAVDAAERAYASMDVPLFEKATTEVDFVVPCLEEGLDPGLAARLHRLRGLGRFAAGDPTGATEELSAARVLDPAYVFPTEMLPEGFELRTLYEGLPTESTAAMSRLPRPRGGSLLLDGSTERLRPQDRSVVFQRLEDEAVVETVVLAPSDPVPWYPGVAKTRTWLTVGSLGTAAVGGAFYGAALQSGGGLDRATGPGDLESRAATTNALGGIAVGLFGVALAEGVAAVLVGRP